MQETNGTRVVGRGGLSGRLLDPVPAEGKRKRVRVGLDTGEVIEVPASLLHRRSPGTFEIALGMEDLKRQHAEADRTAEDTVVPVLAEEVRVGKKAVPTGSVRVHRRVHEHEETVDVPLLKEHVDVRRVLIEREVDGPLPVRHDGDTTIIPIVEEVLVISKKFVLKEEVHVLRTVREERHHEQIVVRRQEPEIERIEMPATRPVARVPRPAKERTQRPKGRSIIADVYSKP